MFAWEQGGLVPEGRFPSHTLVGCLHPMLGTPVGFQAVTVKRAITFHNHAVCLEGNVLCGLDALVVADHLADFLVETLGVDPRGHGQIAAHGFRPDNLSRIPAKARIFDLVEDRLGGSFVEFKRHDPGLLVLKQTDARFVVQGYRERIWHQGPVASARETLDEGGRLLG